MSAGWRILLHELQKAQDRQEVTEIWHRSFLFFDDRRLIYSHREETVISMPSKTWPRNFIHGGFLRPLFAHDNLYLLDRRIAKERWLRNALEEHSRSIIIFATQPFLLCVSAHVHNKRRAMM